MASWHSRGIKHIKHIKGEIGEMPMMLLEERHALRRVVRAVYVCMYKRRDSKENGVEFYFVAANAKELFACPDVDGGLVGGASLKSREFTEIAKSF